MCCTGARSKEESSPDPLFVKDETSRGKMIVFAVAIILGIGSLIVAGIGMSGYWQVGSLSSLSQTDVIIMMAAGGVGFISSLVIPIIWTVCQRHGSIENAHSSGSSENLPVSNTTEVSTNPVLPPEPAPSELVCAQDEKTLAQQRALHGKLPTTATNAAPGKQVQDVSLVNYSFIMADPQRAEAKRKVAEYLADHASHDMTKRELFSIAIMLGMAIGDAYGAPFEFSRFKPEGYQPQDKFFRLNDFKLEPWQWTDDTSMGLCLADVLIDNPHLDTMQLLWAFHDWWYHGYNNPFTVGEPRTSIGLGSDISMTLLTACNDLKREDRGAFATTQGNIYTSGNGSIMRLAPVAITACTEQEALRMGAEQSRVTHRGDEAAGCSELLAFLLFHALANEESAPEKRKEFLFKKIEQFESSCPSVTGLARSESAVQNPQKVEENREKVKKGKKGKDSTEDWNWKAPNFTFNDYRLQTAPGSPFIGSYAMDALAMALHCVYTTASFEEAIKKAAGRGGDADTVGAVTGQIAAAIYGLSGIPQDWIQGIYKWDRGGEIATRGYLLCHTLGED